MLPMREVRFHLPGFWLHGFSPERDYANDKTGIKRRMLHGQFHVVLPYLFCL
jgi:hypothetical protein